MKSTLKRTWAEIDLDALTYNYHTIRKHIGPDVRFLGVVKADAYGHGSLQVATKLQELGADYLAVSSIDEALELRFQRHHHADSDSGTHAEGTGGSADLL